MPATPPIRCAPSSMATCRSASPPPRSHLLFFTLELNRIDDAMLEAAMARSGARPLPAVDRGRAQGEALSARGPGRGAVPREVGHRLFGLEPAITTRPSPSLRFKIGGKALAHRAGAQSVAGRRRQEAQGGGAGARQDLQGKLAAVHADHQHARQGQGNFRPLARLQGRRRRAPSCPTASSPRWWRRWSPRCARPIRSFRTAIMR